MKKLLILGLMHVAFIGFSAFQTQSNAEFKFENETHDFGKIPQGKPVTFEFKFANVGTEPIIISKVESTCGCTVPKYTQAPIKPGDSGSINVTYNASAVSHFSKSVRVFSNTKTPVKSLYIKGEVTN
ncbi:Protein of unknown function [bacterium A37T11]|nr:Protein of unknown function [bacterium A37T11]